MALIEGIFEPGLVVTTVDWVLNWSRQRSIFPMTFGIACCAIEMIATGASRFDIDRFGLRPGRLT
jgi:NADH-quinone oxidoreductase subunit B